LIGPAVGGLVAATVGFGGVVAMDALTYLIAAVLTALISVTSQPGGGQATTGLALRKIAQEWLTGIRLIGGENTVRILVIGAALTAIGESIMSVLFIPFVTRILRGDALHVGGLMSA
jgi:hypothetical protein